MEFVAERQTVKAVFYVDVHERVLGVWKRFDASKVHHQDNASQQHFLHMREFLTEHNLTTMPQTPLKKTALKRYHLDDNDVI